MTRHHAKSYDERIEAPKEVPFTLAEEASRDAEEATWEEKKPALYLASLRTKRNALLDSSDWTQYSDSPLDDEVKNNWAVYRQELRDLPTTTDDPVNPTWPTKPTGD